MTMPWLKIPNQFRPISVKHTNPQQNYPINLEPLFNTPFTCQANNIKQDSIQSNRLKPTNFESFSKMFHKKTTMHILTLMVDKNYVEHFVHSSFFVQCLVPRAKVTSLSLSVSVGRSMRIWETCKVYNDPDRVAEFLIKQTTSSPFTSVTCIVKVKLDRLLENPKSKICEISGISGILAAFYLS